MSNLTPNSGDCVWSIASDVMVGLPWTWMVATVFILTALLFPIKRAWPFISGLLTHSGRRTQGSARVWRLLKINPGLLSLSTHQTSCVQFPPPIATSLQQRVILTDQTEPVKLQETISHSAQ